MLFKEMISSVWGCKELLKQGKCEIVTLLPLKALTEQERVVCGKGSDPGECGFCSVCSLVFNFPWHRRASPLIV